MVGLLAVPPEEQDKYRDGAHPAPRCYCGCPVSQTSTRRRLRPRTNAALRPAARGHDDDVIHVEAGNAALVDPDPWTFTAPHPQYLFDSPTELTDLVDGNYLAIEPRHAHMNML